MFLGSKRRLEVTIHTSPLQVVPEGVAHAPRIQLLPLLQVMPSLPDLRIVGLNLRVESVKEDYVRDLQAYLPRTLSALLIWADLESTAIPTKHWTDLVMMSAVYCSLYAAVRNANCILPPCPYSVVCGLPAPPLPAHNSGLL